MTGVWGAFSPKIARQRGISIVVVVIVVVITIVLCTASLILWANMEEKYRIQISLSKDELAKAKAKDPSLKTMVSREEQIASEQVLVQAERAKSGEPTGFPVTGETSELPTGDVLNYMKQIRTTYYTGEAKEETGKKRREESSLFMTLQELVQLAIARVAQEKNHVDELALDKSIAQDRVQNAQKNAPTWKEKKDQANKKYTEDISALHTEQSKRKTEFESRLAAINKVKKDADDATAAEAQEFEDRKTKYDNEIHELQRQLNELKVKEVIKHEVSFSHGRVLNPDAINKTAFIDIGSRERVVTGLKFLAAKRGEQAKLVFKGELTVKKVWMTYSEVEIARVFDKDAPVTEGDLIVNPLFSKDRAIVVAFAGNDKPQKLKYPTDEATRRIREIGGEVRDMRDVYDGKKPFPLDVDYLIWTEAKKDLARELDPVYQKAVLLEIPIAEALDIYRFLGD